jgi:hypothetical protein
MANPTTVYNLPDGRRAVNVTEAKSLVVADQGIVQNVIGDGFDVTLPATLVGKSFTIRNGGVKATGGPAGAVSDGTVLVSIAVASGDGFTGNGFTAAINKKALNTKATSKVGDEVTVIGTGTNSALAWNFSNVKGIWAREA